MYVYADCAATTEMSNKAIDAMTNIMKEIYGNPSSLHSVGQKAAEYLLQARIDVADAIGADFKEIYFTSGGSEADNQALVSAAYFGKLKGKNHLISTTIEHHAILHTLEKLKKEGFEVTLVEVEENGIVDPKKIEEAITEKTALVTVMFANNEIGTIQPIKEIGKICKEKQVLFHTDAVQAVGHVPVNVKELGVDLLSLSAHKFHGPKGIGVLYASKKVPLTNIIEGGAQERGKRAGTENLAGIVSMATALKESVNNIEDKIKKTEERRKQIIEGLSQISHSILNGDANKRLPGNVNFCFEGIEGESLLLLLDSKGVAASSGSACTSGSLDPSHVLLAIGRPHEIAHGSLRLSFDETLTEEEVKHIIQSTKEVVEYLRSISPVWDELERGEINHVI
ncbi:MAG: cysteine desulfurase [Eubacterium sp.]|nr:cysteine desulfurase [Eubacterium sp.]